MSLLFNILCRFAIAFLIRRWIGQNPRLYSPNWFSLCEAVGSEYHFAKEFFWGVKAGAVHQCSSTCDGSDLDLMIWTGFIAVSSDMPSIYLLTVLFVTELSYFNFKLKSTSCPRVSVRGCEQSVIIIIVVNVFSEWVSLWRSVEGKAIGTKNGH